MGIHIVAWRASSLQGGHTRGLGVQIPVAPPGYAFCYMLFALRNRPGDPGAVLVSQLTAVVL